MKPSHMAIAAIMLVIFAVCTACGSAAQLASDLGSDEGTAGTTEQASKSSSDSSGDWSSAISGDSATGPNYGDLTKSSAVLNEEELEIIVTTDGPIPVSLIDDMILYSIDFVVYDPDNASSSTGFMADVSEQMSIRGQSSTGETLQATHSASSTISAAKNLNNDPADYFSCGSDITDEANVETAAMMKFAIDGNVAQLTVPTSVLRYSLEQLCDLEVGVIVQVFSETYGHIIDRSDRMQLTNGVCKTYTRTRCYSDDKCEDLITAQLMSKDECAAIGPNSEDCTDI
jgi:hypothetical protein